MRTSLDDLSSLGVPVEIGGSVDGQATAPPRNRDGGTGEKDVLRTAQALTRRGLMIGAAGGAMALTVPAGLAATPWPTQP